MAGWAAVAGWAAAGLAKAAAGWETAAVATAVHAAVAGSAAESQKRACKG